MPPILSLLLLSTSAVFPVGSYQVDLSRSPVKSRGILAAYFGQSLLRINRKGTFALCGIEQQGYWRKEGSQYVLVYGGFFGLQSSKSEQELRKTWPQSHAEGMVLRRGPAGSLVLAEWGAVKGPIVFLPMAKRSLSELIVASDPKQSDKIDKFQSEAWESVHDRIDAEWPEMLRFIDNPKYAWQVRSWAGIMFEGVHDPKAINSAASLILTIRPTVPETRTATLRRALARAVVAAPTSQAADLLLQANRKGLLRPADIAEALGALRRQEDVPTLMQWLDSAGKYDKLRSLDALAAIGATDGLEKARVLTGDAEESVQLAAYGLVARVSPDPIERRVAVRKISEWTKSSSFLMPFQALETLSRCESPEALPYLVALLGSDREAMIRRNTAIALGNMGDSRAVPALLEARSWRLGPGSIAAESQVRRAAAEALVKIGKRKRH